MNKKLFNVLLFTAGAAVGSFVTWKVVKTRYERIAQEEINSVKETWTRLMHAEEDSCDADEFDNDDQEDWNEGDVDEAEFDESDMIDYSALASMYKQSGEEAENDGEGDGDAEVPYINGPYVIAPGDFGDGKYDHDLYCLTYYSDGVLANDWWEEINIDETIGQDSLEHFGDYAEDIVHVRNERLKADYEVVRDYRDYADVVANDPLMRTYED